MRAPAVALMASFRSLSVTAFFRGVAVFLLTESPQATDDWQLPVLALACSSNDLFDENDAWHTAHSWLGPTSPDADDFCLDFVFAVLDYF